MTPSFTSQPLRQGKRTCPFPIFYTSRSRTLSTPERPPPPSRIGEKSDSLRLCIHPADVDHYYRSACTRGAIQQYKSIRKTRFLLLFFSSAEKPLLKYYRGKLINFQRRNWFWNQFFFFFFTSLTFPFCTWNWIKTSESANRSAVYFLLNEFPRRFDDF